MCSFDFGQNNRLCKESSTVSWLKSSEKHLLFSWRRADAPFTVVMQRVVLGWPPAQSSDPFQRVPSSWEHWTDAGKEIIPAGEATSDSSTSEQGAVIRSEGIPAEATFATFSLLPPAMLPTPFASLVSCRPSSVRPPGWRDSLTAHHLHSRDHTPGITFLGSRSEHWMASFVFIDLYSNLPLPYTSVCIFRLWTHQQTALYFST